MENQFEKLNCEAVELECFESNSTLSAMFHAQTAWTGLVIKATSFCSIVSIIFDHLNYVKTK